MAEKFTPGEWVTRPGNTTVLDKKSNPIAMVYRAEYYRSKEESFANVALIKAAPEMYRALEDVCSDCERLSNWEDAHNLGIPVGQPCPCKDCYVEKALKKARGEE